MALIDPSVLMGIADRAAKQYKIIYDSFAEASAEGSGFYFDRVSDTDDSQLEIPTVSTYKGADDGFLVEDAIRRGTGLDGIISGMEGHFNIRDGSNIPLQIGGWDGYLQSQDIRVSWWFAEVYRSVKRRKMLANNVFSESDDLFGSVELTSGPGLSFTDGSDYGSGGDNNRADGSMYAPTQLRAVVVAMSSSDLDLGVRVKDANDNLETIEITIPASSAVGTSIDVGNSSDRFLDIVGVNFVSGGSFGTIGDTVSFYNKKERDISL